jgi:hypothetical protein
MNTSTADLTFLGREFLTWLWFKSEEREGTVMVPDSGDIGIIFAQKMVLASGEGQYSETVACSGIYSDLKEGKAALRKGKKIKEARIKLAIESDECEFTFKADSFQIQTMKLPPTLNMAEEEAEKEGRILERIYLTETAFGMMEKLFMLFLGKRLSPQWDSEEVPKIKKWMPE